MRVCHKSVTHPHGLCYREFELFSENRCDHKAKLECEEIFFCSITELSDIRKLKELKELKELRR